MILKTSQNHIHVSIIPVFTDRQDKLAGTGDFLFSTSRTNPPSHTDKALALFKDKEKRILWNNFAVRQEKSLTKTFNGQYKNQGPTDLLLTMEKKLLDQVM